MSSKDISFQLENTIFQYRCGCMIVKNGKVLVMRENINDEYDYFVGGRVQIGEDSQTALCRELDEELGIKNPKLILKAILENFFSLNHRPYHELGLYYVLVDEKQLPVCDFERLDSDGKNHYYSWITVADLDKYTIYPKVIKENVRRLLETTEIVHLNQIDESYIKS